MLGIYRRHKRRCPHHGLRRKNDDCECPIWVDKRVKGLRIHKSLLTNDEDEVEDKLREFKAKGGHAVSQNSDQPLTLREAWLRFLADLEARKLQPSTIRKYRLLQRQMHEFAFANNLQFLTKFDVDW